MRRNTNLFQARWSSQWATIQACALEAMRTQASPDLCSGFKPLIAFNFNLHGLHVIEIETAVPIYHPPLAHGN
jgi:hypothetical protein